jgi:hypothetical protein
LAAADDAVEEGASGASDASTTPAVVATGAPVFADVRLYGDANDAAFADVDDRVHDAWPQWVADQAGVFTADGYTWRALATATTRRRRATRGRVTEWEEIRAERVAPTEDEEAERVFACHHERVLEDGRRVPEARVVVTSRGGAYNEEDEEDDN